LTDNKTERLNPGSVAELLYHDDPMILVDRVVKRLDDGVICETDITSGTLFADDKGVPAYVAIEYMAQAIGVFDGIIRKESSRKPEIGFLLGSRKFELFTNRFLFGQTLKITVKRIWDGEKVVQFDCIVEDARSLDTVAKATLTVYSPSRII